MALQRTIPENKKISDCKSWPIIRHIAWPIKNRQTIIPLFLPFLGCPHRCIFCNQEQQSGAQSIHNSKQLEKYLDSCSQLLLTRQNNGKPAPEIAFYGGTFTLLPDWAWQKCLQWANNERKHGTISQFRCSTRPDSLEPQRLDELQNAGCHLVELGIQSYDDKSLRLSQRGYTGEYAVNAPAKLANHGLLCGIQLLPGMPGNTPRIFLRDMLHALEAKPACMRLYPCLVLNGTPLAAIWRKGGFTPWNLEQTISTLAKAWIMAAENAVPIIRIGLAPQDGLESAILAGPDHPALGAKVMAAALYMAVQNILKALPPGETAVILPRHCQGFFWGNNGELRAAWLKLGITNQNMRFEQRNDILIACKPE